ncbi:ABC transporter ATP-binding protein/permease [Porticoccaceae bacterium]|nr:ABC transporter ATP-binding protein/permease [Porticoccaceae bacterium]
MSNLTLKQLLLLLWHHINPRRRVQFWVLFLAMIVASFAEVISIGAVLPFLGALTAPEGIFNHAMAQPFIHALNLTEPEQVLLPLTIVFSVGAVVSGLMRFLLLWVQTRVSYGVGADISFSIYRRTLYQPYAVHAARNSSEVISGISNKANFVVADTILPLGSIITSIIMMLSILIVLLAVEPVVASAAFIGFGVIYLGVVLATRQAVARNSRRINYEAGRVIKALQEGLGGIRDVLIDGAQVIYCKVYRNADVPMRRAQASIALISGFPRYGIEALGMVLISVLAYSLATKSTNFSDAIPILGVLALGAQRLLPVLQLAYSSWTKVRGGQEVLRDVLDLLEQPLPSYLDSPPQSIMVFNERVTLNDVSFKYVKDGPWVLRDGLSVSIPKGSRIGFIGATGSGKSTLLDILMGLLEPTGGSLAIDGVVVNELNQRAWQAHIAHVPQAIFLADSSIAENIAFGVPKEEIDYGRLYQAAEKAQIAEAIESWSQQYETLVGERGVRLSGGQRQRIGIARALYKEADVIVLDEATSALDTVTESEVMEAIKGLGDEITVIIVAHRLTTLKNCTQIVELQDGEIKRIGSYNDIVDQSA